MTRLGTVNAQGERMVGRAYFENPVTGRKWVEELWRGPKPEGKPLARPSNGHGQHWAEWAQAIARSRT